MQQQQQQQRPQQQQQQQQQPQQQQQQQQYNGGYYYREGFAPSNPNSLRRSRMDFIATKWPRAFMATATIQAILCLVFEA